MSDNNSVTVVDERGFRHRAKEVRDALNKKVPGLSLMWNWVYFVIKVAIAVITLVAIAEALALTAWVLGYDAKELTTYITNTFYTTNDNEASLGWQVLTSPGWSGLTRTTPYTDVKFEQYYECMWTAQVAWGVCNNNSVDAYKSCMTSSYSTKLTTCSNPQTGASWPTLQVYTQCLTTAFNPGNRTVLNSLRVCAGQDLWPLYEQVQDIDSSFFLGAFSWPLLMLTGFFLFLLFALYTFYPVDFEDTSIIEHGKAGVGMMGLTRLGIVWTFLPLAGAISWVAVSLAIAFRSGSAWPNNFTNAYPSTQTTNVVIVTSAFAVLFYFLLELAEFGDRKVRDHRFKAKAQVTSFMAGIPQVAFMQTDKSSLGYVFPDPFDNQQMESIASVGMAYTPVLLNTWADAYLVDILFLVGAVGATLQVLTADVYNLFWVLVYYRVAHMGMVRALYESYVHSEVESREDNAAKGSNQYTGVHGQGTLAMRVLALSFQFAAVYALYIVCAIVFNTNRMLTEYPTLTALFVLALIVPEAIRVAGNLFLVFYADEGRKKGVYILVVAHFLWMWDLFIRAVFILIFFWGDSGIRGTKPFLVLRLQNVTDTLSYMM